MHTLLGLESPQACTNRRVCLQRLLAHGDSVPANGNGAASSNGADSWRSDGSAGTLFGAEARLAGCCLGLCSVAAAAVDCLHSCDD